MLVARARAVVAQAAEVKERDTEESALLKHAARVDKDLAAEARVRKGRAQAGVERVRGCVQLAARAAALAEAMEAAVVARAWAAVELTMGAWTGTAAAGTTGKAERIRRNQHKAVSYI